MKRFVLIGLMIVLSKLSFVCADIPNKGSDSAGTSTFRPSTSSIKFLNIERQLKYLAGKMIYRDVFAQNEIEFSAEYINEPYKLFSYNENLMELKDSGGKSIILKRSLWDDGNWKECVSAGYSIKLDTI